MDGAAHCFLQYRAGKDGADGEAEVIELTKRQVPPLPCSHALSPEIVFIAMTMRTACVCARARAHAPIMLRACVRLHASSLHARTRPREHVSHTHACMHHAQRGLVNGGCEFLGLKVKPPEDPQSKSWCLVFSEDDAQASIITLCPAASVDTVHTGLLTFERACRTRGTI